MADFETNLARALLASSLSAFSLQVSRELFAKSYFALAPAEKEMVDRAVVGLVGANYRVVTPQWLDEQTARPPIGFQSPTGEPAKGPAIPASSPSPRAPRSETSES